MKLDKDQLDYFNRGLDDGIVQIVIDTRVPGVEVPDHLHNHVNEKFNISRRFSPADLEVDEDGIRQTLSFSGASFKCMFPWESVLAWMFKSGNFGINFNALPAEVSMRVAEVLFTQAVPPLGHAEPAKPKPPPFTLIKGGND